MERILSPLAATATLEWLGNEDGMCQSILCAQCGGLTGQAGVIRHELARGVECVSSRYIPTAAQAVVILDERSVKGGATEKIGHLSHMARKIAQWVKR